MSLLDAFLEDSLLNTVMQQEVWLAIRSDGVKGAGTELDPYNCAGAPTDISPRFDAIMAQIVSAPGPVSVRLQPGIYYTKGYNVSDGAGTWQPKDSMRLQGSGMDVTTIRLCNTALPSKLTCVIGSAYKTTFIDGFEVSDLTVNCNYPITNASVGGIAVSGKNILIQRVRATNFGVNGTGPICLVLSAARAYSSIPYNCVISNCRVDGPGASTGSLACIALHLSAEKASVGTDYSYHEGCGIRDCLVDFGTAATPDFTKNYVGFVSGGGRGAIVENNQFKNCKFGQSADNQFVTIDQIIRNNYFFNVPFAFSNTATGGVGTVGRLVILKNIIDFPDTGLFAAGVIGLSLDGNNTIGTFAEVVIRQNVFRRYNNSTTIAADLGISLNGCGNVVVENNVIKVATANNALSYQYCGTVQVFNNRATDGTFYPAYNLSTFRHNGELTTDVEDSILAI